VLATLAMLGKDLLLEQGRRLKDRWKHIDSIEEKKASRLLTREQELQELVDKYAEQRMADMREQFQQTLNERTLRFEDLQRELERVRGERDYYLNLSMTLMINGEDAATVRKRAASRELTRSHPGLPLNQLLEISEASDDGENDDK